MIEGDVLDLLMRIYAIWPSALPPESRRKVTGDQWCHLLAGIKNTRLMNEALDSYATGPSGKYAPKPSDLIGVYEELQNRLRRRMALQAGEGKCPLCGGFGRALVDGAEPFYGNYGGLVVKCPCSRPGELRALQGGQRVTRDIKGSRMELWLENDRLYGALHEFRVKPRTEAWPLEKQSGRTEAMRQAMQTELDLPPF